MRYFVYKHGNQGAEITKQQYEEYKLLRQVAFGKKPSTRILLKSQ